MLGAVIEIVAFDPVAVAPVTLRAASHDIADVCHMNGATWWPAIAKLPRLRYDLFDGAFEGKITSPESALTLAIEAWPSFARYQFSDASFRLWTGEVGAAWGTWVRRFDGRVTKQPKVKDGRADIDFAVDDRWLDGPLLYTYAGTTGAEGPAAMKGQAKPIALGAPRFVPGKLIDAVNSVFQISAYGPIQAVTEAFERVQRFGAPIANYATYAALVAAAIPPGRYATALAVGMARFGAPTTGLVTFHVQGDTSGPDGWARLPGELVRRIALLSGGAGKIHDASLDALDVARPYNQSLYIGEQTTARDVIQRIAASVNAVAGVSWLGELFMVPVGIGAPSLTLAADGSALPPVASVEQIEVAAPFKRLAVGAERTWGVHPLSDVAFTAELIERGWYDPTETYREGHIVTLPNGSRWLDVSTVPITGISPAPGAPEWSMIQGATSLTALGAGDLAFKDRIAYLGDIDGLPAISDRFWPFSYPDFAAFDQDWAYSGTGEMAFVSSGDTGGRAIIFGNNDGDDFVGLISREWMAYSPDDLYELTLDIEGGSPAGGNVCYAGLQAVDKAGNNLGESYNYMLLNGVVTSTLSRQVRKAYLKGTWGVAAQHTPGTPAAPTGMPDGSLNGFGQGGTVKIRPVLLLNYPDKPGSVVPYSVRLRRIPGALAAQAAASWSSQVSGRPANLTILLGGEGINNAGITISAGGALLGGGGGQVTLPGMGYTGSLTATSNLELVAADESAWSLALLNLQGNSIYQLVSDAQYAACVRAAGSGFFPGPCYVRQRITPGAWNMMDIDDDATSSLYSDQALHLQYFPGSGFSLYSGATQLYTANPGTRLGEMIMAIDGVNVIVQLGDYEVRVPIPPAITAAARLFPKWHAYNYNTRYYGLECGGFTDNRWSTIGGPGTPEDEAEVGSNIAGPALIEIECDYTGAVKPGQLPRDVPYRLLRKSADITGTAAWSRTASGPLTCTIGAATGILNITAMPGDSKVRLKATVGAVDRYWDLDVRRKIDPPPFGAGGSGTGGTSASTALFDSVSGTSMVTVSSELQVTVGSNGFADVSLTTAYTPDADYEGSWGLAAIIQEWNGSAWVDLFTEQEEAVTARLIWNGDYMEYQAGQLGISFRLSGRTPASTPKFRVRARRTNNSTLVYFSSSLFSVVGS